MRLTATVEIRQRMILQRAALALATICRVVVMSDKVTNPKCPGCGSSQIQRSSPKLLKSLEPPQSYRCENGHSFIVRGDDMAAASSK